MDEDEICKMPAGKDIDALVAVKVMNRSGKIRLQHFSSDISAAWEVVEKVGEWHGFVFMVRRAYTSGMWEAGWFEPDNEGYERRAAAIAPTVPLAICRAALIIVAWQEATGLP